MLGCFFNIVTDLNVFFNDMLSISYRLSEVICCLCFIVDTFIFLLFPEARQLRGVKGHGDFSNFHFCKLVVSILSLSVSKIYQLI